MPEPVIRLEPFELDGIERLLGWLPDDEAVLQWAGSAFALPLDAEQLRAHVRTAALAREIYRARCDGAVVGHAELGAIDGYHGVARIGRMLIAPDRRGCGLGEAMLRALVARGFDGLGLHRLELGVFDFNRAAIRCYERVGFVREGLRRETTRAGAGYWSLIDMALLAHERS